MRNFLALAGGLLILSLPGAARGEDLPPLTLARGLPSHTVCAAHWDIAYAYRDWLWSRLVAEDVLPRDWPPGRYFEACHLNDVWEHAAGATDPKAAERTRREALRGLAGAAGWRAVMTGELPNPVPLAMFAVTRELPPAPYPVGVPQRSAVGNRALGWVYIEHQVTREGNGYRYRFDFQSKARARVLVRWEVTEGRSFGMFPGLAVSGDWFSDKAPVWRTGAVVLETLENGRRRLVGTWQQAGPVPDPGKGP